MKILCGPDLHIRVTAPEYRIDDFVETQKHKIEWILKLAKKQKCELVLFPGDLTDSPRLPYWIIRYYVLSLTERPRPFFVVVVKGQHDMLYHVDVENTPLMLMEASKAIKVAGEPPLVFDKRKVKGDMQYTSGYVCIYGASWNEKIPEHDPPRDDTTNILLIHKMFIHDKLWEGQEEYTRSLIFLKKTKWDLIVSGDNHQHFSSFQSENRFHINCGSLMRQNIDQIHHKPVVYIYDTELKVITPHYIPIDPYEEVFDLNRAEEKKERDSKMETFIENIKRKHGVIEGMDFDKNISGRLDQDDIDDATRDMTKEMIKNAYSRLQ